MADMIVASAAVLDLPPGGAEIAASSVPSGLMYFTCCASVGEEEYSSGKPKQWPNSWAYCHAVVDPDTSMTGPVRPGRGGVGGALAAWWGCAGRLPDINT